MLEKEWFESNLTGQDEKGNTFGNFWMARDMAKGCTDTGDLGFSIKEKDIAKKKKLSGPRIIAL